MHNNSETQHPLETPSAAEALRQSRGEKRKLLHEKNARQKEQKIMSFLAREAARGHFYILTTASHMLSWSLYLSPRTLSKYLKGLITKGRLVLLQNPERYGLTRPGLGRKYLVCREMNLNPDPFESEQSSPAAVSNHSQRAR